jgi:hypothetical protein
VLSSRGRTRRGSARAGEGSKTRLRALARPNLVVAPIVLLVSVLVSKEFCAGSALGDVLLRLGVLSQGGPWEDDNRDLKCGRAETDSPRFSRRRESWE